jgi:hypothetical protein
MPTYVRDGGVWKEVSGSSLPEGSTFPTGTLMLFQQTEAPIGWTKQPTHNNKALRVVTGTAGSGGTTNFTGVFASRTPAGTNSAGSVSNHTLLETQIPSHYHLANPGGGSYFLRGPASGVAYELSPGTGFALGGNFIEGWFSKDRTANAGGGGSHNHGFTNPTFTGTAMDFDVQYVDLIIARKD